MKIKLSILLTISLFAMALTSCGQLGPTQSVASNADGGTDRAILSESEDMGKEYIDSFVFFGESTTYHLKSRGVLSGGRNTTQVLGNKSGTAILDTDTASTSVTYPETGETVTFMQAIEQKKPKYLFMSFGLNGAAYKIKRGKEYFKGCYRELVRSVKAVSPQTRIILASCYPVAENMDMSRYSLTLDELNEAIRTLNGWTLELCREEKLKYLNVNEVLTDKDGRLRLEYQVGDGHHLTEGAYVKILEYIRTHGYK